MAKMKNEICRNCGQLENEHPHQWKACKRFEAYPDTLEGNYDHLEQKGCGKGYRYFNGANYQKNYCGIDG
ncbi:hypothetical protein LCGC14_3156040, partial [marine sediment metagenome]